MISLNAKQFKRSVVYKNASEVIFDDHVYIKGPSFSAQIQAAAIKYCNLHESKNLLTLLVKQQECLTVWLQQSK